MPGFTVLCGLLIHFCSKTVRNSQPSNVNSFLTSNGALNRFLIQGLNLLELPKYSFLL